MIKYRAAMLRYPEKGPDRLLQRRTARSRQESPLRHRITYTENSLRRGKYRRYAAPRGTRITITFEARCRSERVHEARTDASIPDFDYGPRTCKGQLRALERFPTSV
jgi:hypothetical protein